ncbi:MAG: glycosyltransferase [Janthinobacterium lividum]
MAQQEIPDSNLPEQISSPEFTLRLDGSVAAGTGQRTSPAVAPQTEELSTHELTILIPARNEAENLPGCLESLLGQSEPGFLLGDQWHIVVIDDDSTDDTYAIAEQFAVAHAGLSVLRAKQLTPRRNGFTGKNAACWLGASQPVAQTAKWLLFTDADTLHEPGSTHRAIVEAERHELGLLSYSPRQITTGLVQRGLLPLVFSELASTYPPKRVSDPSDPVAAANGQFLLVQRQAYADVGGHQAVASAVLEDVALARLLKRRHAIRLRYAPDAVSTRMYRGVGDMVEGWTKNLALLFGNPLFLAAGTLLNFVLLLGLPLLPGFMPSLQFWQMVAIGVLWLRVVLRYFSRVGRSHAPLGDRMLSVLALPLFAFLLVRSWQRVKVAKSVTWKGREYHT